MCGIAGILSRKGQYTQESLESTVKKMISTLIHRGPDDSGTWLDENAGLAFGHRRLSIIDRSKKGRQPMISSNNRYVICYNGEVYNFPYLRQELEDCGNKFISRTDTEVVLTAIVQWGLKPAIRRFNGMFAFAIWDRAERKLHLIRDRLGIKPLYYGWVVNGWAFSSELKALTAVPGFCNQVDRDSLAMFMRHNYIPAPYSIYRNIFKLPPGSMITLRQGQTTSEVSPMVYWNLREIAQEGISKPFDGSLSEAIESLESLIESSTQLRMISDVPLGVFLSGGIDSSLITTFLQKHSTRPIKTFTIGFKDRVYNEADYALQVSKHLGTEHNELYIKQEEALCIVPQLSTFYDEPFADSSQIPTFFVCKLAKMHATVSLSGDGGDELFCGYNRYPRNLKLWNQIQLIPASLRKMLFTILEFLPQSTHSGGKLVRLKQIINTSNPLEFYHAMMSTWQKMDSLVIGSNERKTVFVSGDCERKFNNLQNAMMVKDMISYLPDDILVKVDRASMANSLEVRVPLLDHRIVEFVWKLPLDWKWHDNVSKWIIRKILYKYVPRKLVERPKKGFSVPLNYWLKGPLRDWAEELLSSHRIKNDGFFDVKEIRRMWHQHLSGKHNRASYLWSVLMFQAWLEKQNV